MLQQWRSRKANGLSLSYGSFLKGHTIVWFLFWRGFFPGMKTFQPHSQLSNKQNVVAKRLQLNMTFSILVDMIIHVKRRYGFSFYLFIHYHHYNPRKYSLLIF